jgi:uncharacterized membrane protein YidH (DUF202 family)
MIEILLVVLGALALARAAARRQRAPERLRRPRPR